MPITALGNASRKASVMYGDVQFSKAVENDVDNWTFPYFVDAFLEQ